MKREQYIALIVIAFIAYIVYDKIINASEVNENGELGDEEGQSPNRRSNSNERSSNFSQRAIQNVDISAIDYNRLVSEAYKDFISYKQMLGGYNLKGNLTKGIYDGVRRSKIERDIPFFEKITFGDFDSLVIPPYSQEIAQAMSNFRALESPMSFTGLNDKNFYKRMRESYERVGKTKEIIGFNLVEKLESYQQIANKLDRSALGFKPEVGFSEVKKIWDKISYNLEIVSNDIRNKIITNA